MYLYGFSTGGGAPSATFTSGQYASVTDLGGYIGVALAATTSNSNSFTSSSGFPMIGGAELSSFSSYSEYYGSNNAAAAPSASVTFAVTSSNSLVVIIALASSEQCQSISGLPGFTQDASNVGTVGLPPDVTIGHAYPSTGMYTVTEYTSQCAAGQTPDYASDLIGAFVFVPTTTSLSSPTISTTLAPLPVSPGGNVHDTATLSGETSNAGGTVTYYWYYLSGSCSGSSTSDTVVVTSGSIPNSASYGPLSVGTYSWQAVYSGDANNNGATSSCDPLTVSSSTTLTTSLASSTITIAGSTTDTATLNGGVGPTGSATFNVYSGSSSSVCTGAPAYTFSGTTFSGTTSTATVTGLPTGSYEVQATYHGDTNNAAATSPCGSEPLTVETLAPGFRLQVSPLSQTVALTGNVTFMITITPLSNPPSQVSLSVATPGGISCSIGQTATLSQNCDYSLSTLPRTIPLYLYTFSFTETNQPMTMSVVATAGSQSQQVTLTLVAVKMVGVQNSVTITDSSVSSGSVTIADSSVSSGTTYSKSGGICNDGSPSSCFSLQQNFFVNDPTESNQPAYWIQNIVDVENTGSGYAAAESAQIWYNTGGGLVTIGCSPGSPGLASGCSQPASTSFTPISLPTTFNLMSVISSAGLTLYDNGNQMTINYLSYATPPSPTSYVSGLCNSGFGGLCSVLSPYSELGMNPQLDTVGEVSCLQGALSCISASNIGVAWFSQPTKIDIGSYAMLANGPWSQDIIKTAAPFPPNSNSLSTATGERAVYLSWSSLGTNIGELQYSTTFYGDQGVAFVPSSAISTTSLSGGGAILAQTLTTGVSVKITGSNAPEETIVTVISQDLGSTKPTGTGSVSLGSATYFDVEIQGLSSYTLGNAEVCITNAAVTSTTLMEYGSGWVFALSPPPPGSFPIGGKVTGTPPAQPFAA